MCSNHELQATLNALGYLEDGVYYKSKDCLNCAKDLVRYLRRDDPNEKTVRRELLKTDVISNDLIPLLKVLKAGKKDAELFDLTLRLLVNLTQSALNCFELKIPEDKLKYNIFIEIDNYLKKTKEPFTDEQFCQVICDKLKEIVTKSWEDREEEEDMIAERILYLIRNMLQMKPCDDDIANRLETDINAHDMMIRSLHKAKLFETLIEMTESSSYIKYSPHILEIIVLALRDQSPEELAKVSDKEINLKSKRSVVEKSKDSDELAKLLNKDKQTKKVNNKLRMNSRHSRFMGTYVATNMKSINDDNNLIVHKQARNMGDLLDDQSKIGLKKSKNKLALESEDCQQHRSVLFIRIILKEFCFRFMKQSYNIFLRNVRDLIQRKKLEDEEVCYYYWLIQFLTEFNRNTDIDEQLKLEQTKETFALEIFHSVEIYIQRCIEMMRMEKKQSRLWSKRMHIALKCYKEQLVTLFVLEKKIVAFNEANNVKPASTVDKPTQSATGDDEADLVNMAEDLMDQEKPKDVSFEEPVVVKSLLDERATNLLTKLKNQIFYIQEFRELFVTLLKDFDANKMSKAFLRDLIEANHIFILLLEYHTKKNGVLSVMSKKKKKKTKSGKDGKGKKKPKETKEEKQKRLAEQKEYKKRLDAQKPDYKEYCWQTQFSKIGSLLQNADELRCEEDDLMPFDFGMVTNDEEFDAQKDGVIEKIQKLLSDKKPSDSITLFREARSLWPKDKELFGEAQIAADEEFEVFKSLYFKELEIKKPEVKETNKPTDNENQPQDDEGIEDDLVNEELDEYQKEVEGDGDASDGGNYETQEENLDFEKFLFRYTHPHILKSFILMLGEYAKNSDFLNRCCMNMFERIAYECHATPCLYQLSLFNLINIMYKDPLSRCCMDIMDKTAQKKAIDDIYASTYSTEDMFAFFRQLIAKFFEQVKTNDKLFLEVLFFKEKKVVTSLGEDGGGYEALHQEEASKKNKKVAWSQDQQDELKKLYEEYKANSDEIRKDEGDIVDRLMTNISQDRKRREICNQLVNIGCAQSIEQLEEEVKEAGVKKLGRQRIWRPEDLDELKQCFQMVKENATQSDRELKEMMGQLQESLSIKRNKHAVADKLVELNLIQDSSEILGSKKHRSKKDFLANNMNDFVRSDADDSTDEEAERRKKEKKKEKKKLKKSKKSKEKSNGNDLFDAESGSSSNSSDSENDVTSSSSSSSDSDSDGDIPNTLQLEPSEDEDMPTAPFETAKDDEITKKKPKKSKKSSKHKLQLSEDDSDAEEDKAKDSDEAELPTEEKENTKEQKKRQKLEKSMQRRQKRRDILSLVLSEESDQSDKDTDLISNLITDAKKNTEQPKSKSRKTILSDESDSETSDKPKENLKSDESVDKAEIEEKLADSPIKTKNVKKRKKTFKIIDDSSNSSTSNMEAPIVASTKPTKVLSEIANSENAQNIKVNKTETLARVGTAESLLASVNSDEDSDEDSDDDDDMPLSMKIQQPKRQRLILSDGDDD